MKILRIELRNFKPFKKLTLPEDDTDLPDGLLLIRGPNSTGKSSLFEGILWGLWGSDAVALTNDELVNFTSTFCAVNLEFEVAGVRYKIHREYDPAQGLSVVLFTQKDGSWKPIADKSKSVKRKMDEILNLEIKQALDTLLVRQGEVADIANARPVRLRKLLEDIYDIGLLKQMERHLSYMEKDIDTRMSVLRDEYMPPAQVQETIERFHTRIESLRTSIKQRTEEIRATEASVKGVPDSQTLQRISEAESDVERFTNEIATIRENLEVDLEQAGLLDVDMSLIKARLKSLEKVREKIESEKVEMSSSIARIDKDLGGIEGANKDLREKISHLKGSGVGEDGQIVCPTCSKPLSPEERDRLVAEYEQRIKAGKTRSDTLRKERKELVKALSEADKKLTQTTRSEEATNRVKSTHGQLSAVEKRLESAKKELTNLLSESGIKSIVSLLKKHKAESVHDLRTRVVTVSESVKKMRRDIKEFEAGIKQEEDQIADLEKKRERMEQLRQEIDELQKIKSHTEYVRKKLVTGFVADYIFQKRLIGIIRSATNQYVKHFTNGQYTIVDLEPTRQTRASGSGLILKIWDERDQAWKKTTQLSFGDRTAISLGLRLGISRTMSSIRPLRDSPVRQPRVRSVLLDEPLGGLDKSRRESVVRNLVNDQGFEQIFLITHTDVQGWEDVPSIEVSKEGSSSTATLKIQSE
ncbi:MAG: AAA family ATPase [Candidatus Thorarchaeota archaeon]